MRFNMRIPVLFPAVAFPTHLALEGFDTQVLIHVLLQVLRLVKALITAVEWGQHKTTTQKYVCIKMLRSHLSVDVHIEKRVCK